MRMIPSLFCFYLILSCTTPNDTADQPAGQPEVKGATQEQAPVQINQQNQTLNQDAGASFKEDVTAPTATTAAANAINTIDAGSVKNVTAIFNSTGLVFGKYGCTASKYVNGSYEYIPRGYFTISAEGEYIYYGLDKPSKGSFTVDSEGNLHFKGGYFDQGKAEKIDRPNKFFLVFPTIPDNRWTCGLVDDEG